MNQLSGVLFHVDAGNANAMGANVVYLSDDIDFTTSVTFYGQAYACNISDDF